MITNNQPSFTGMTKIYAITDSHQETRKTRAFLSRILHETINDKNVLFLNCGDMFKGIYSKNLERDSYIKMKSAKPDIEMVTTIGNNDFGFNRESLDYLIDTIRNFTSKGIKTVCANIFQTDGKRPDWLLPYTVVNRDGDRTFITGFCINNINTAKFGIVPKPQTDVINEILNAIKKEKPENVIILNHDYMPVSKDIVETCKNNGIKIDIVIGGHDHDIVHPDTELNIYYPHSFSDSMYKMNLINNNGSSQVNNVEMIKNEGLKVDKVFSKDLEEYEQSSGLSEKLAPYVLNLTKQYSKPCPIGSFLADNMKTDANADIAFFSTGFIMKPMDYQPDSFITNYLFRKTMSAVNPIKTVELDSQQIFEVFSHALRNNEYSLSNPKFLQCSNNVKIEGKNNPSLGIWEVKQIYIDNKPLLDKNSTPLPSNKKYKCAIDSYIADGGQGFTTLQKAAKNDVIINNTQLTIDEVLKKALIQASDKYEKGSTYPQFELIEK